MFLNWVCLRMNFAVPSIHGVNIKGVNTRISISITHNYNNIIWVIRDAVAANDRYGNATLVKPLRMFPLCNAYQYIHKVAHRTQSVGTIHKWQLVMCQFTKFFTWRFSNFSYNSQFPFRWRLWIKICNSFIYTILHNLKKNANRYITTVDGKL